MAANSNAKTPHTNPFLKLSWFQKLLFFFGVFILIFTALPAVIVILIGLLPTITVILTDSKNTAKLTVVGCFNLAGVFICLFNIFNQFSVTNAFSILGNIFNLIIMLGSAALGVILYFELPNLFVMFSKLSAQHRLRNIDARLEKLAESWGTEAVAEKDK